MRASNPLASVRLSESDPVARRHDSPAFGRGRLWDFGVLIAVVAMSMPWAAGCGRSEPPAISPPVGGAPASSKIESPPAPAPANAPVVASPPGATAATIASAALTSPGSRLYAQYCATCHGENGDGNGTAARFLYPKPRNFREGQYRMVTAVNRIPTDQDLMNVIVRGMPGSAMFPVAAHLPEADRKALVAYVRDLSRQGIEDNVRKEAKEFGEEATPEDIQARLASHGTPGAVLEMPGDLPADDAASVQRGRELYVKGCATCHGDTGKGDGVQEQRDEFGLPVRPRDLTQGIFKGGRSTEQLYARISLGIPGSPMPASPAMKPAEIGDLVHYIQSLSDVKLSARSEHRRGKVHAKKAAESLPESIPAAVWDAAPETQLVASPLWWRDHDDPDLRVRAVHDDQDVAIRVSWRDGSQNDQSGHVLDFPDMVAVELFQGAAEPFLGMGAADSAVDVWLWNAAAQADRQGYQDVDTAHPNMAVDMYPFEKTGEGKRAHPTDRQPREFLTALAAGNLRSDPDHPADATSLQAKGFGSTTMRPKTSQMVKAVGEYKEGRWTVVLRRPLQVAKDAGLPMAQGDALSVAFAIWEGSVHDRNGQKMVSIWHDLIVE